MKRLLIISYVTLVLAGGVIVFLIPMCQLDKLEVFISIIGGISTFFTLIIAFLLYDKLVIDKPFFDKQKDSVFSLLDELRDASFLIINEEYGTKFEPIRADQEFTKSLFDDYLERLVAYSYESIVKLENITDHSKNIYLPKSISKKLEEISVPIPGSLEEEKLDKYVFVVFKKTGKHEAHKADIENFCTPLPFRRDTTVKEYLEKWEELIVSIKEWLDENSSTNIELNL